MPIFAVAVLALTGGSRIALLVPALAGVAVLAAAVVVFGLLMWKQAVAHRIGAALGCCASWLRRPVGKLPVSGWDEAAVRFRQRSNDLVARRWPALAVTTLLSHLALYLLFLLTAAPITPGGVGVRS